MSDACPLPENADLTRRGASRGWLRVMRRTADGNGQAAPLPEPMGSDEASLSRWADRAACDDGHRGPFIEAPDHSDWLYHLLPDAPVLPQYHCCNCGSTRGFTIEELRRGR